MFDVTALKERYFDIKIEDEHDELVVLHLYGPSKDDMTKLKTLMSNPDDVDTDALYELVHHFLNKNKDHIVIPESLTYGMSFDIVVSILYAYFDWVSEVRAEKN